MAKESMKARERKRAKTVAKYAEKRKALKEAGDYEALQKLPKNASPVRMHNRCKLTGRPKGYMRQFGISRVTFREMANQGLIPGVKKASHYTLRVNPKMARFLTTKIFHLFGYRKRVKKGDRLYFTKRDRKISPLN